VVENFSYYQEKTLRAGRGHGFTDIDGEYETVWTRRLLSIEASSGCVMLKAE
jgi:hypothetical protein